MKVAALYKTWRGNEFVRASLESIYQYCDPIVFVHSQISWAGNHGNDVEPIVTEWKKAHGDRKICQHTGIYRNQEEQYAIGLNIIRKNFDADHTLLIDTDEIWPEADLLRLFTYARLDPNAVALSCKMHTYIKDVHYRIVPPEPCSPTVLIRNDVEMEGVRGNRIPGKKLMETVFFHHPTLIRAQFKDVAMKAYLSNMGDGMQCVDMDVWRREKWDNMPNVTSFHISRRFENVWQSIKVVPDSDLPELMLTDWRKLCNGHKESKPSVLTNT